MVGCYWPVLNLVLGFIFVLGHGLKSYTIMLMLLQDYWVLLSLFSVSEFLFKSARYTVRFGHYCPFFARYMVRLGHYCPFSTSLRFVFLFAFFGLI